MKSLVVVADHPVVVQAIRLALRHTAGFRVAATLDGRSSVRERLATLQPDVILVDEMCQRTNAISRLREACELAPGAKIVLLSGGLDATALDDAFEAGAEAVISRHLHPVTLGSLTSHRVGDPVAVIGDPFDVQRSLSTGVISGLDRTISGLNGYSIPHVVGTCAMGPDPEEGAVVDASGRVHGIDNLYVADASIIPEPVSGFSHLPTLMVAERLAEVVAKAG